MALNPKKLGKQSLRLRLKVFIDSSVLIAAAISSRGSARDLIIKSLHGEFEVVVSDLVIEETQRNLANKAPEALPALQFFLEALNPEVVNPSKTLISRIAKVIEVKDAAIVAGAFFSEADYLVSYDRKHLLQLKEKIKINFQVRVVTPDELVK